MVPVTRRRGVTLLEVVVALPLLLLVAALAVQGFVTSLRLITQQETRLSNVRELEHAALALAADLRPLAGWDVESWSDTTVVAYVPVLTGYVCDTPAADIVDVAIGVAGAAAHAVVLADPRAGDVLAWVGLDSAISGIPSAELDTARRRGEVGAVALAASACADSPIRGAASPWRVSLVAAPTALPMVGTPVTLARRTEWRSYRASDAAYYLGRREWSGSAWSTIQPVAGPLHASADGGMVLRMLRADGSMATAGLGNARQLELLLRAPRGAAMSDSLHVRLALRGAGY